MGKYVHICLYCGVAAGYRGSTSRPALECINCGKEITWEEWKSFPVKPKPEYEKYFENHPEEWDNIVRGYTEKVKE